MLRSGPLHLPRRLHSHLTTQTVVSEELPAAAYRPSAIENGKYKKWEDRGLFRAECEGERGYSMVLPPPNVTGKLHLGHALACTIQDVIVRRQRSLGKCVLWLPGMDHAGIATQGVVEKYLKNKQNTDRHQLGRDKFNQEVLKWKDKHGNAICDQLRILGASLDWSRQTFTMDDKQTHAINVAFVRLFEKGLIYRKQALVNWCVQLKSTLSDIEVDSLSVATPTELPVSDYDRPVKFGFITEFAYRVCDRDEEIVVATTRPETMLGDVAVAVHPEDQRYKHLHGSRVHHPFREDTLPIIPDDFVDMNFGTGAVKITPAHDKTDYDFGLRHNLKIIQVIDESGRMTKNCVQFRHLKRYECRDILTEKLNNLGVLKNVKPHVMTLPICSRTGDVIEILPKEQWFVSCKELNKKAGDAVKSGELKIKPDHFIKNWLNWTEDDRDWCISRQLWWGHQIPAYMCRHDGKETWIAALNEYEAKSKAVKVLNCTEADVNVKRDDDVLDTWFSSGLYPFSSLGWPVKTKDFEKFYPLSLMATGHDILGFWVHRMVILGLELTGKLPFKDVLLHGIICDNKGAKMSKSRGNVIDPIDVINGITLQKLNERSEDMFKSGLLNKTELKRTKSYNTSNFTNGIPECGVDALRFTLMSRDVKSHFVQFDVDLCHANKLFCNKIWQSLKYIQLSFAKLKEVESVNKDDLSVIDRWILSRLACAVETVNISIDNYDFHLATKAIKDLMYYEFCDIYLEATKPGFDDVNLKGAYAHAHTLSAILNVGLRSMAPFMVYLTDELIPKIPNFGENIIYNFNDSDKMQYDFPLSKDFQKWRDEKLESDINLFNDAVSLVRQLKGFYGVTNKNKPKIFVQSIDDKIISCILKNKIIFTHLTRCGDIVLTDDNRSDISLTGDKTNAHIITGVLSKECLVSLQLADIEENRILVKSARKKLTNKIKKVEESLSKVVSLVSNGKYAASTPEDVQNKHLERIDKLKAELVQLNRLSGV